MDNRVPGPQRLAHLIAYLSLCMLAAAFGALVEPSWLRWWALFGTFGLVSAVGFDAISRCRARIELQRREKQMSRRAEQSLNEVCSKMQSSEAILAAVREITQTADVEPSQLRTKPTKQRLPVHKQVTITPVCGFPKGKVGRLGDSFTGYVQNISGSGIGLAHDRRLERGPVLLAFELTGGDQIQLIADLFWCELQDDGAYHSGGKILEVVTPSDAQPVATA